MREFNFKNGVMLVEYEKNKIGVFSNGLNTDIVANDYSAMIIDDKSGSAFVFMIYSKTIYNNVTIMCDSLDELNAIAHIFSIEVKDSRVV